MSAVVGGTAISTSIFTPVVIGETPASLL